MDDVINETIMSATVEASKNMAEAMTLGFDNCKQEGSPLTFNQQLHMQQAAIFTFRDYEKTLRKVVNMILLIDEFAQDEDIESIEDMVKKAAQNNKEEA